MKDLNIYEILLYSLSDRIKDDEEHENTVVALTGFYYAIICCDNEVSEPEKEDLQKFINKIIFSDKISDKTKSLIFPVANFSITFEKLLPLLDKVKLQYLEFFNAIFEYIVSLDNDYNMKEQSFAEKWTLYMGEREFKDVDYDTELAHILKTTVAFTLLLIDSCDTKKRLDSSFDEIKYEIDEIKDIDDLGRFVKAIEFMEKKNFNETNNPFIKSWKEYYKIRTS